MFNSIKSLFQIGNNTQTNTIIYDAKIDSSIKRMKKDFNEGSFGQAIDFLDSLFVENEHNEEIKYQLLIVKSSFLLQLRQMDDFKEYLVLIEKKYSEFIDIKYKELKLTLMAFLGEEEFFSYSKQLRLETPESKPQSHFDIVFYLNSKDPNKAKEIFDSAIKEEEHRDKLLLIGGHIYSNLYQYDDNDDSNFKIADKYYVEAVEKNGLNFLDKMQIQSFYTTQTINDMMRQKKPTVTKMPDLINDYKNSLDVVFTHQEYFDKTYIRSLYDNYIFTLLSLNLIDDYISFYEANSSKMTMKDYIQYCDIKKIDYDHSKIHKFIQDNYSLEDLLAYASIAINKKYENTKEVIEFFESDDIYLSKHSFISYCFVKGNILLKQTIKRHLIKQLSNNKYNDIDSLLAYIEYQIYLDKNVTKDNIFQLLTFATDETRSEPRLIEVFSLLQKKGYVKEYLDLALSKQDIFRNIIFEVLIICEDDTNLLFEDFENFIGHIKDKKELNAIIGNTYLKYNKLDIALNYYYEEFKKNQTLELMLHILHVSLIFFHRSGLNYEEKKQFQIYNLVITKILDLDILNLIFLLRYSVDIIDDTKQVIPILNQKLLNSDINELSDEEKMQLSGINLYLTNQYNINNGKDKALHYKGNICLQKENTFFVTKEFTILKKNQENYPIKYSDESVYELNRYRDEYKELSLFHIITGSFIGHLHNPYVQVVMIDTSKEDPFSEILEMLKTQGKSTQDMFQRYSSGDTLGFYNMAGKEYEKYFALIPTLIEDEKITFISNKINVMPISRRKILTLSSIVFLEHINKLDDVLKRDDIYIQRTLLNWLQSYISTLASTNEMFSMSSDGTNYFKQLSDKKEIEKVKKYLVMVAGKILSTKRIVEDHLEVLPIKGAYEMLADHLGPQEYQALAFCVNHNYQIITEDNLFDTIFKSFRYTPTYISNALSLLSENANYEKTRTLRIDLYTKQYKYVLEESYILNLVQYMIKNDISHLHEDEKKLIKIAHSYGWLDKIKKYYQNKFQVLFPKVKIPRKTFLDTNIQKIMELIK